MLIPEQYDTIIIGGGTAGLRTALRCEGKTALFEPNVLGGTCLNTGCIPTKALLYAAESFEEAKRLKEIGITCTPKLNFPQLMKRVKGIVQEGQDHIKKGLKKNPLTVIRKPAKFLNKRLISAGHKLYTANKIIIATGTRNSVPPIKGLESYLTNENVLNLKKLPKSIIMVGGGYIAMEFATFFHALGVKVTVLELGPCILGAVDEDVSVCLTGHYRPKGVDIKPNVCVSEVRNTKTGVGVVVNDLANPSKHKILRAEKIFLATGRRPNTESLGLKAAGIDLDRKGYIQVNKYLQTTNKDVYAVGDVNGKALFAHAAKREVAVVLDNLQGKKRIMDHSLVPWTVFTNPPISGVGICEDEAAKKGPVGVLKANFTRVGRAHIMRQKEGFVKVVFNKKNKKILGAAIIGPRADDMIHEFVALMNCKGTIIDLKRMIHVHPTLSEVMENLKEVL